MSNHVYLGCASGGGTLLALRALMLIRLARLLRLLALSPRFRLLLAALRVSIIKLKSILE